MLALLTCSASRDDAFLDDDEDNINSSYGYTASMRRRRNSVEKFLKTPTEKRRRKGKSASPPLVIGSPTNFRHDVHLGRDLKADHSYLLWDVERWREELAKRDLILPPVRIPERSTAQQWSPESPSSASTLTFQHQTRLPCSKRSSLPPQKRKPVPLLNPCDVVPSQPVPSSAPQDVPLPPSPLTPDSTSDSDSSSSSVPALDTPSRGPSIDDVSLPETMDKPWISSSAEIRERQHCKDPGIDQDKNNTTTGHHHHQ